MSTPATRRSPRSIVVAVAAALAALAVALSPTVALADEPADAESSQRPAVSQDKLRFGLKGGIAYADGRGSVELADDDVVGPRPGFSVGAVAIYPVRERLDLQGELLVVRRVTGTTTSGGAFGGEADYQIRGTFVQLPLLLRYRPDANFGPVAPSVVLGPALSFPTDLTRELTVAGTTQTLELEPGGLDVGVVAGAAFDVPFRDRTITLDARYTLGLRDIDAGVVF